MLPSNLADIEPEDLKCGCCVSEGFHGLNLCIAALTPSVHIILNRLCTTHVINLVDPGAARFLASQLKLLCSFIKAYGIPISCHVSGSPANATISFLPQTLPS